MANLTILAIDDDRDILVLIDHLLKKKNATVIQAESGQKALDILSRTKPDIILLDVMMQGMSGYEVCWRIQEQENLSFIPVIFLTALSSEKDKAKAFALGAVDFITKPIDKTLLYDTIEKHATTENRWRSFLFRKGRPDKQAGGSQTRLTDYSIASFCRFLFEFLDIPANEQEALKNLGTIQLATKLQDSRKLSQSRFMILAGQFVGMDYLASIEADDILMDLLPPKFSRHNRVIALKLEDSYAFAITDPFNSELINILENMKPQKLFAISPETFTSLFRTGQEKGKEIDTLLKDVKELYPDLGTTPLSFDDTDEDEENAEERLRMNLNASPLIQFVNKIIETAYAMRASDIHIEPLEKRIDIRYRIDGELSIVKQVKPRRLINLIVSRIKIMAHMDISERRLPQDGRFSFKEYTREPLDFDVRVSSAPMNYGEKIVMRIIDKKRALLPLADLGFLPDSLAIYRKKLRTPYGMILHVGPTGSGKSMSLYSALNEINHPNINIQTAEDPIEYTLDGISQMQVQPGIGLTFKEALRCFLRQDPDVILVGEIRDRETAGMAVEAALTGHLLFSTLHTNDAPSTVIRLIEMGIAPYMISSSLVLICAQRLLRRLCSQCRKAYEPDDNEKRMAGLKPEVKATFYRAVGCGACGNTGYRGRIGVYELLIPDDRFRAAVVSGRVSTEMLRKIAIEQCGMITLFNDAAQKVRLGITSMREAVSKARQAV